MRRALCLAAAALGCSKGNIGWDSGEVPPGSTETPTDSDSLGETGLEDTEVSLVDPSDVLFDIDRMIEVRIEMEPEDWDTLRLQARSYVSLLGGDDCLDEPFDNPYTWFPASAEIDGTSYDLVGVRKKGLIGSASTSKPGLKVDIDEYIDNPNLHGLDKLTFNNSVQDPALVRQCVAYGVLEDAGIPAPRCGFAHIWVNGEDLGVYVHVERIGRDFLRDHFNGDDGDLYEGTLSDFREGWTGSFEVKNDDTDPDLGPIWDVVQALEASEAELEAELDEVLDLDAYIDFWAAEVLVGHWDGYAGNTNNFYVYAEPADGRLRFIPWGTDGALVTWYEPHGVYATGALAQRLYLHPDLGQRYIDRMRELLDSVWDEPAILERIDRMEATVLPEVGADLSEVLEGVAEVRTVVSDRRADIERELGMSWPEGLRGSPCLIEVGHISATMQTTWGTLESSADPFGEGETVVDFTWEGEEVPIAGAGSLAGFSADLPLVAAAIELTDGSLVLPYVYWWEPDSAAPGVTLPIDGGSADGAIQYTDESLGWYWETIGYLGDGTLSFDAVGYTSGDPVIATMDAAIYGGW